MSRDLTDVSDLSIIQQKIRFTFRLYFSMMNKLCLDKDWWTCGAASVTLRKRRSRVSTLIYITDS